ncbi:MAG: gliding motility-associated C-terminal domain-containing protein [Bacteroidetes bacterium]|nr:gliding motility-associated C-terminal domain-containing protein [Bacteroidota bacterium]
MRKLVAIVFVYLAAISVSHATHILGGEITYEHLSNLEYKVWVTIYRDCNECKLAGGGGGTSTQDCGGFDLYVQRSDKYSCSPSVLDNFKLTRTDIKQIVPVCSSIKTACDTGSNRYSHGIEAHVFYAVVDFDKYSSAASCGFDLFVKVFDRADDIDNINGQNKSFYNYAFINPSETHSTDHLTKYPDLILAANQPVRMPFSDIVSTTDSIVYKLGTPLEDHNTTITYSTGYTKDRPMTVWCNGSTPCTADPSADPPIGNWFNPITGMNVFTPVKTNEKAVIVYEMYRYRKIGSGYTLISIVRRDIQVLTVQSDNNNPEFTVSDRDIHVCAGDKLELEINANDDVFVYPDGSKGSQNSVNFEWDAEFTSGSINQQSIAQAPYAKLMVSWNTSSTDVRNKPYKLMVSMTDDNCPLQGRSSAVFNVYVHALPEFKTNRKQLWCGNVAHKIAVTNNTVLDSVYQLWKWNMDPVYENIKAQDTFFVPKSGKYHVNTKVLSNFGCSAVKVDSFVISEDDKNGLRLEILHDNSYCLGGTMELTAKTSEPNGASIDSTIWSYHGVHIQKGKQYFTDLTAVDQYEDGIKVSSFGRYSGLKCISTTNFAPEINTGPDIQFDSPLDVCYGPNIDLMDYVSPKGGTWIAIGHGTLDSSVVDMTELDSANLHELCQSYTVENETNHCQSVDTLCFRIHPIPDLVLKELTICNQSGPFNMAIVVEKPFGLEPYTVDWTINGRTDLVSLTDKKYLTELSTLLDGENQIDVLITNEAGCQRSASTTLHLTKSLDFTVDGVSEICQGDNRHLSDIFNIVPKGGMWNSFDNYDELIENHIDPEYCGSFKATYTYDQFGCFGTKDVFFDIKCRPTITFNIPDSICSSEGQLALSATPDPGEFRGTHVVNDELIVQDLSGPTQLRYELSSNGCDFRYDFSVEVVKAPRFTYPAIPASLCENDSLRIDAIRADRGIMTFWTNEDTFRFENTDFGSFVIRPSAANKPNGVINLNLLKAGISPCPSEQESFKINVRPLGDIQLPVDSLVGCTPYHLNSGFDLNSEVDWDKANVSWTYNDIHSNDNLSKGKQPDHLFEHEGIYNVDVSVATQYGCWSAFRFDSILTVYQSPHASFTMNPDEPVSVRLPLVRFTNASTGYGDLSYLWNFGTYLKRDTSTQPSPTFFFVGDTATYRVTMTVTDERGCTDVATRNVIVEQDIQLFIPNAFSPNRKGPEINESFGVKGNNVSSFEIEIVNRWGEVVYYSRDINERWSGYYLGELCQGGIFAYRVNVISDTGGEYEFTGTLNMIR